MKTPAAQTTDGLEWLRAIRRDLQQEIGTKPKERSLYYQAKEKKLRARLYAGRAPGIAIK
jgi:hypothetical protein